MVDKNFTRMLSLKNIDKFFLLNVVALTTIGFLVFISASMGLAERQEINIYKFIANQLFFGVICGFIAAIGFAMLGNINWLKKYAVWIFGAAILLTLMVFAPVIGGYHGGATRWIYIGPLSLQPAEILKIAFVIFWSAYLCKYKTELHNWRYGLLPYLVFTGIAVLTLVIQPDLDGAATIIFASSVLFFIAGVRWKHIFVLLLIASIAIGGVFTYFSYTNSSSFTYVKTRINTFLSPNSDPQGSGYQVQQSLIAIGSGGIAGKGFGQSVQKFKYLPESNSDAIFSVAAEEFGFVGSVIIIFLFFILFLRSTQIAARSNDTFAGLLTVGLITLITIQSFINIASMIAIMPLSGLPLAFFSKGGTSLFFILLSCGIIMNVSKHNRKKII